MRDCSSIRLRTPPQEQIHLQMAQPGNRLQVIAAFVMKVVACITSVTALFSGTKIELDWMNILSSHRPDVGPETVLLFVIHLVCT